MKFFLYIILIAYSLQLTAHSQKREQLITHWRGDKKTYSFTENGDWAAHKLSFAVKTGRAITDDRLIWKRNTLAGGDSSQIYASYSSTSGKTTFAITILQVDAEDLPGTDYVWDLEATDTSDTTDVTTLFDGIFRIKPDTQTRFDGVNIPPAGTRFYWAPLDSSAHEPGFLINRNSTNLATWISKDSTKSLLDVVDKSSLQNINKQKNFLGGAKFGNDSSLTITNMVLVEDSNFVFFKVRAKDGLGDINFGTYNHNDGNGGNTDKTIVWGFNVGGGGYWETPGVPACYWSIERRFWIGSGYQFEPHLEFVDESGTVRKPLSFGFHHTTGYTDGSLNFHKLRIKSPDNNSDFITIYDDTTYGYGKRVIFHDTIPLMFDINNVPYLWQKDNTGASRPLIYINSVNKIRIASDGGELPLLIGSDGYQRALFTNTYQRFAETVYITGSSYNHSIHPDTAMAISLNPAGYGKIQVQHLYVPVQDFNIVNDNFTQVLQVHRAFNELYFGPSYRVGTGDVYSRAYYSTISGGDYTDNVVFYATEISADNTIPSFFTKGSGVITTTPTPDTGIYIRINGTLYAVPAEVVP